MNPKFEVGMKVCSIANGEGIISCIDEVDKLVVAGLKAHGLQEVLPDGRAWEEDKYPTLFILPGPVPFKKGMKVFEAGKGYGIITDIFELNNHLLIAGINWHYGGSSLCRMDGKHDPKQPYPSVLIPADDGND